MKKQHILTSVIAINMLMFLFSCSHLKGETPSGDITYKIIQVDSHDHLTKEQISQFELDVTTALNQGWHCVGGVSVMPGHLAQAIAK
jgi:hypothetical protein